MKLKVAIVFYSLAVVYVIIAALALFTDIKIPPTFSGYVSVVALLVTGYDLSKASYDVVERKSKYKFSKRLAHGAEYFFLLIAITGSVYFILFFMKETDELLITKVTNYASFGSLGIVFLTYGMKTRTS
ncbi:hypothetical protein ABER99_21495 [Paenibacillus glucanolyticus]|jgi:Ni,Fe-hydrogenase I cytochrome b subunit|uniref:Uncharacterized protein n=1 Tax=Paenibacillus glucanolyticus TaxID=59843 RepID=A0A163GV56_9BACL|nr:hypothetical protein [Paenibacillus glucanolyticus]KZS45169.1 hypothetical protein AWU65_04085 [Paenibacillus glucanolyticus]OMF63866.1 hypothetical protein BK142_32430 [Paenibacillus glucanolyticus]